MSKPCEVISGDIVDQLLKASTLTDKLAAELRYDIGKKDRQIAKLTEKVVELEAELKKLRHPELQQQTTGTVAK